MPDVYFGRMETVIDTGPATLTVEETEEGVLLRAKDKNGVTEGTVHNGKDGQNGQDGRDGRDGLDGAPGAPGKDGTSPMAVVDRTANGAIITITDTNGTTEAEVLDGPPGEPLRWEDLTSEQKEELKGTDGYTPVKGIDYFTAADIAEITQTVQDAMEEQLDGKQDTLVSGMNVKTFNNESLLGSGDIPLKTLDNQSLIGIGNIGVRAKILWNEEQKYAMLQDLNSKVDIGFNKETDHTLRIQEYAPDSRGNIQTIFNMEIPNKPYVDAAVAGVDNMKHIVVGEERLIGDWTENGVTYDLYEKVVDFGELPNATSKTVAHGITNSVKFTKAYGFANGTGSGGNNFFIPFINAGATLNIYLGIGNKNITITTNSDRSNMTAQVYIEFIRARN